MHFSNSMVLVVSRLGFRSLLFCSSRFSCLVFVHLVTQSLFTFCKARWAIWKKRKENHKTKVTKIPKTKRRKYGMNKTMITGKSLSEALVFASTNPQYDNILVIELQVQYMKMASSEHGENVGRTCVEHIVCTNCLFFVLKFRTTYV